MRREKESLAERKKVEQHKRELDRKKEDCAEIASVEPKESCAVQKRVEQKERELDKKRVE